MKSQEQENEHEFTRREVMKYAGMALGGLAFGGTFIGGGVGQAKADLVCDSSFYPQDTYNPERYTYFEKLNDIIPWGLDSQYNLIGEPLLEDEMRITFLGSVVPSARRAQQEMSVFVEVGWDATNQCPLDQFVFDCGSGVCANYGSAGISYGRMDKIFLAHLHADHMSDLAHIYCFGPSSDRKSPLYVWGPGPSGVRSPRPPRRLYNDGTKAFCEHLREAMRWHSESFSFESTSWEDSAQNLPTQKSWGLPVPPKPVADDPADDGYALVPIELDWTKYGAKKDDNVAYHNKATGVKITHFPVIHTRRGAIGYKLEWQTPNGKVLTMIYTSDTRPEWHCVDQAINADKHGKPRGVDVFIHEMGLPPEVWAMKNAGLPGPVDNATFQATVDDMSTIINCSHTPPGAFGYLLGQISPRPRLTVATHFPVADDTVHCALESIKKYVPDITWTEDYYNDNDDIAWSFDLMVLRVIASQDKIIRCKAQVNDFSFSPVSKYYAMKDPKYMDSRSQIDTSSEIPATEDDGTQNYCESGY
nr:hypothetical protein [uncultured Desulfobulbus sp.]